MTVIPVYNIIVLPNTIVYIPSDVFKSVAGKEAVEGEEIFFIFTKNNKQNQIDLTLDDIYPIGIHGSVIKDDKNSGTFTKIKTSERALIEKINKNENGYELELRAKPDIFDLDPLLVKEKNDKMIKALANFFSFFQWGTFAKDFMQQRESIFEIIGLLSSWLSLSNKERYELISIDSQSKRAELVEKYCYEFLEMFKISNEAKNAQMQDDQKIYREAAIRKQMDFLQKELDILHPENVSDVRRFAQKIKKLNLNEEARVEAQKVLNRMQQEGRNSPEYGILYDYLDFLTSLAWSKPENGEIDIKKAEVILNRDHFGLEKVKKRILEQLAIMSLTKQQNSTILLFVGAPGTGKTSICKSIAEALKRKYVRISLGGIKDEADIRGHRRTYIGALPGRILDGIAKSGVNNPVFVLDEIDKLSSSYNGDPASALLEVLDPEQNFSFTDHYLNVPYDLSNCLFIATANSLDNIPEPLLNRMEVIEFSGYTAKEKLAIAKKYLLPNSLKETGLNKKQVSLKDKILKVLIDAYTFEGGVRNLKKLIDTLLRSIALAILQGKEIKEIETEDLPLLLDKRPYNHEKTLACKKIGVVTGLAYTRMGGDILFIESLLSSGSGKLILTGHLGEIMKESASIALSLVKAIYPKESSILAKKDLHIHVPEGAIPKDGPSAGITLTTCLASLLTGKAIASKVAMTGEVSLRGAILPIGGLNEKLMAATRAGVEIVYIPEENKLDLLKVPQEVKDKLTIKPVKNVKDVLKDLALL